MEVKILNQQNQEQIVKFSDKISGYDLLNQYAKEQNKNDIVAFSVDNQVRDLFSHVSNDATVKFIYKQDQEGWKVLNYSCALVLAYVVKKLYPKATIAVAQNTDTGFYLDFDYQKQLKQEDLLKISTEMSKVLQTKLAITHSCQQLPEVLDLYKNNPFAQQYAELTHINGRKASYLVDNKTKVIASGVAISTSSPIKYFQLTSVTGAYWLGDDKNKQLQRISGICDWEKEGLVAKIAEIEKRKSYDHRVLGKKLNIFMFNDEVGKGLPIFLPNGMTIKKTLQAYLREQEFKWDYQEVSTPVLGSVELYKKSGHWDHYQENMFAPIVNDNEQLVLRPMTCPHHCMIYQSVPRSYRDLPIRLSEHALLYRYETSGALTGLERVRSMELSDSHIFVRLDQIKEEFKRCYHLITEVLETLNIKISYFSLSLRDPEDKEKYYNDDQMWDHAENELREVLNELKIDYQEMIGEAAFYGPKFDIQIKTPLGHEVTISTIQFDFLLPKRFELTYIDNKNREMSPVIIHRGLIGTYERFIATLLEQTQGVFPLWLAFQQVAILPINDSEVISQYTEEIHNALKAKNIRSEIVKEDTLGKRIRLVHENKIPYVLIIGAKEQQAKNLTYHTYKEQKDNKTLSKEEFIKLLEKEIIAKK
ncbi:threonine--tRNA ligase [Spiroplasma platyhelix]|uniref:Threonine--tRNA ligase n=1 Tax=Spiroplasma platyhelix PALS-1 TaxID=1276218 RepID=A0A846UA30_9MOLU|nr:threonine--tRNA ligase [Spiroplasma platyhelix]MBE4704351.1 Threonine--tRNA ligase [Spiroplasma platyhelix PALS-1]NKE38723.1 threonine--tRNA ligase [Spiroplasma platyhelix PALS-1]UJB28933.1 threonyl-tRNA synthetase [Spiroplasma platyhelix PALS-1]